MNILTGEPVANQIYRELQLSAPGFRPHLAIILIGDNPASKIYIQKKCEAIERHCNGTASVYTFSEEDSQQIVHEKIQELNQNPLVHGIILQLPIAPHFDRSDLLSAIDPQKDVDGLSHHNLGQLIQNKSQSSMIPATPLAVTKILEYYQIPVLRKHVCIVNDSILVGKPLALMLIDSGATVTLCNKNTQDLRGHMTQADIVITAIGKPNFFRGDDIKHGAVVIDIGISKTPEGTTTGDFDQPSIAPKAAAYTPVPGGVGPVTVACLIHNLY